MVPAIEAPPFCPDCNGPDWEPDERRIAADAPDLLYLVGFPGCIKVGMTVEPAGGYGTFWLCQDLEVRSRLVQSLLRRNDAKMSKPGSADRLAGQLDPALEHLHQRR